jgi:hypothetical protein
MGTRSASVGSPFAIFTMCPAVGGVNGSLTIQAIACRRADRIAELAEQGELERGARSRLVRALT